MRVIYANDDLGGYDRRCTYFVGPIIGAGISQVIQQFFYTCFGDRWPLVFGLLFVLIVMFLPYGIVGTCRVCSKAGSVSGDYFHQIRKIILQLIQNEPLRNISFIRSNTCKWVIKLNIFNQ